jgi:hypothetical protein
MLFLLFRVFFYVHYCQYRFWVVFRAYGRPLAWGELILQNITTLVYTDWRCFVFRISLCAYIYMYMKYINNYMYKFNFCNFISSFNKSSLSKYCDVHAVGLTLLGNMHAVGLKSRRFLVTARQSTMPKAVSSLQSVQRSYISDNEAEVKQQQS